MSLLHTTESRIDKIIESLGLRIIAKGVLISKSPLYALTTKDKRIVLVEVLKDDAYDFISNHIDWLQRNLSSFSAKYNFDFDKVENFNLVCLYNGKEEINFEIPNPIENIEVYTLEQQNNFSYRNFYNYTLNIRFLKELLDKFLKPEQKQRLKEFFSQLIKQRPLICRKLSSNFLILESGEERHYLYFFENFLWYHKGKAPFYPKKIF